MLTLFKTKYLKYIATSFYSITQKSQVLIFSFILEQTKVTIPTFGKLYQSSQF